MNLICNHESGIEAQSEMTDNLVFIGFIFVFLQKISSTGEGNLVDIFFYLVSGHSKTVISEGKGFIVRVDNNVDFRLIIGWKGIFSHHFQLL